MKPRGDVSVESAVQHIRAYGDQIDADPQLRFSTGTLSGTLALMATAIPVGLEEAAGPVSQIEAGLPYILYGTVAYGAQRTYKYLKRRRAVMKSEDMQDVSEAELDEPMDLVRYGKGKNRGLLLRWYGYDDVRESTQTQPFIDRSRSVIEFARKYCIEKIAVCVDDEQTAGFNTEPATTLISDVKRLKYTEIRDTAVAERVVVETIDNFEKLVDTCESEQEETLISQLVQALGDVNVTAKYGEFLRSDSNNAMRQRLLKSVRRSIEMGGDDAHTVAMKQADGTVLRQKVHSSIAVRRGGRVMHFDAATNAENGMSELMVVGVSQLANVAGVSSNDELLATLQSMDIRGMSKPQLLAGLYLLIDRRSEETAVEMGRPVPREEVADAILPAAFPRMYNDDRSPGLHPRSTLRRQSLFWGKKAVALVTAVVLGYGVSKEAQTAYSHDSDKYDAYTRTHGGKPDLAYPGDKSYSEYAKDPDSGHSTLQEWLWRADFKYADEIHFSIADKMAEIFINDLHASAFADMIPDYAHRELEKYLKKWQHDVRLNNTPPDGYVHQSNDLLGDVSSTLNQSVYDVTSLKGESTEGYWAGSVDRLMELTDNSAPFHGAGLDLTPFTNSVNTELPTDISLIKQSEPDFMVETPYINAGENNDLTGGNSGAIMMPIKTGTMIVGARIIDQDNPKSIVKPTVYQGDGGAYFYDADSMDQPMAAQDMKRPVLQYWLKDVSVDPIQEKAKMENFVTFRNQRSKDDVPLTKADRVELARNVREALGLPDDASALDVITALRSKEYSYTPLARAGIKDVELGDESSKAAVNEMAGILAHLDTMNCNVASMTAMLATLSDRNYMQLTGFHDENNDGHLSQQEAHAWLMNRQAKIVDPTPVKFAPGEEPRDMKVDTTKKRPEQHHSPISPEDGAAVLLALAASYAVWRRRAWVGEKADSLRTRMVMNPGTLQSTVRDVERELHGKPEGSVNLGTQAPERHTERYVRNVPAGSAYMHRTASPASVLRRVVIRMNDQAVRRHVSRKNPETEAN